MKPCARFKQRIAWLAADVLPRDEAETVKDHLTNCTGCRGYLAELATICREHSEAAQQLPSVKINPAFQQRLARNLHETQRNPVSIPMFLFLRASFANRRIVIAAAAITLALVVLALRNHEHLSHGNLVDSSNAVSPAAPLDADPPDPSYSNYRMAANCSFEELDKMLALQSTRHPTLPENLTLSAFVGMEPD